MRRSDVTLQGQHVCEAVTASGRSRKMRGACSRTVERAGPCPVALALFPVLRAW